MDDRRCHLIDALRGLALVNMLAYHFLYDVMVVYGRDPRWYLHPAVHVWQQYICCSFILIAGFSFHWGQKHNLRRGLLLNLCGLVITAVTLIVMPTEAIWFGILNFMDLRASNPRSALPSALSSFCSCAGWTTA